MTPRPAGDLPITERELELVRELLGAQLTGHTRVLNTRIDGLDAKISERISGVEKWVKWGALGILTNGIALAITALLAFKAPTTPAGHVGAAVVRTVVGFVS